MSVTHLLLMAIVLNAWDTSSGAFIDFVGKIEMVLHKHTGSDPIGVVENAKNLLLGVPFAAGFGIIDVYCQAAKKIDRRIRHNKEPAAKKLQLVLKRGEFDYFWNLSEPIDEWEMGAFDGRRTTTLFITGWSTHVSSKPNKAMYAAYMHRDETNNFLVVDAAEYLHAQFYWAAYNIEKIGQLFGEALAKIAAKLGILGPIHCIGHSLGGHACSAAALKYFEMTGVRFARATGLDLANPCFYGKKKFAGLQAGDANFVDVMHTNCGVMGIKERHGDVDVFVNTHLPLQPGCLTVLCSHNRSWELFAESAERFRENDFLAESIDYPGAPKISVGYAMPTSAFGGYKLLTRSKSPFGLNAAENQ